MNISSKADGIDMNNSALSPEELRAAYLSQEKYIADIMEIAGNLETGDRFVALLILRAFELGHEVINLAAPLVSQNAQRITL